MAFRYRQILDYTKLFMLLCLICQSYTGPMKSHKKEEFFIILSCDGFRWDYLDMVKSRGRETPNFDFLIKNGVQAEYMKSAFVTLTWPNHLTIATGMYLESHGLVANYIYDPRINATYDGAATPQPIWYNNGTVDGGGEPIWVTYEKASPDHRSATAVWPGGDTEISGRKAYYTLPQDNELTMKQRVDAIIDWFTREEDPAHLGMLYFTEPDHVGHDFGAESKEVEDAIVEIDGMIGYMLQQLKQHQLTVNLIITSDHGQAELKEIYRLVDYIDPDWYTRSGDGSNPMFLPKPGFEDRVYQALLQIPNSRLYRKEEIPREYFYTYNERIMPLILMVDEGYFTCCSTEAEETPPLKGEHGYNNSLSSMHPFFIAHGPAFKSGYFSPPFNSTDIYPLMCHLLDIEPHPNNGSLDNIRHILKNDVGLQSVAGGTSTKTLAFGAVVIGIILVGVALFVRHRPGKSAMMISYQHIGKTTVKTQAERNSLLYEVNDQDSDSGLDEWTLYSQK